MKPRSWVVLILTLPACTATDAETRAEAEEAITSCPSTLTPPAAPPPESPITTGLSPEEKLDLAVRSVRTGDLLFTQIDGSAIGRFVFNHVAELTSSWTSHVGIVLVEPSGEKIVAESTISSHGLIVDRRSRTTPLATFLSHSKDNRFALRRLPRSLSSAEERALRASIDARMNVTYDTGFDLDSPDKSYCSRFVWEVFREALGVDIGRVQTLRQIVDEKKAQDPNYDDTLIRLWFMHLSVPWCRRMVTPASQLLDQDLDAILTTD